MNEKLTIIIPTHNRLLPMKRAIDYYSSWDCRIIICDSSTNFSAETGYSNIDHLHFPKQNFSEKIYNALQMVTTPFVCLCADDDFLSPDGVERGIDFLDSNKDYVSVQGRYVQFWLAGNYVPCVPLYERVFGMHFGEDEPDQRILSSARKGMHHIYSLHRTEVLKHTFSICKDLKLSTLSEYSSNITGMIFGKHIMLPIFWMARDRERYTTYNFNYSKAVENGILHKPELRNYLLSAEGNIFKENFSNLYSKTTGLNISKGRSLFDKVFFEIYLPEENPQPSAQAKKTQATQNKAGLRGVIKSLIPQRYINKRNSKLYPFPFLEEPAFSQDWEKMKMVIKAHGNLNTTKEI